MTSVDGLNDNINFITYFLIINKRYFLLPNSGKVPNIWGGFCDLIKNLFKKLTWRKVNLYFAKNTDFIDEKLAEFYKYLLFHRKKKLCVNLCQKKLEILSRKPGEVREICLSKCVLCCVATLVINFHKTI